MKHFSSQRFLISMLLILSIPVSFTPASTVDAAMSFPTSGIIDNFILEMDRTYGYQILRPASWIASDLGDRREFTYSGSGDQMNRITLEITNLQVVSENSNWELWFTSQLRVVYKRSFHHTLDAKDRSVMGKLWHTIQ